MTSNLKISEAEYINMLSMANSSDKSNLSVVQSILENMDIDTNIVYVLMLYKEISNEQRSSLFTDQISAVVNKHAVIKDGNFKNVDWAQGFIYMPKKIQWNFVRPGEYRNSSHTIVICFRCPFFLRLTRRTRK